MLRRLQLVNFLYKSLQFHERCWVLSSAFSTSSVCQISNVNKNINIKREVIDKKRNYEDTFGDIDSFEQMFNRIRDDPEDILEYKREKSALGKSVVEYIKDIKSHLDNHDYESALKVLEVHTVNDKLPVNRFMYKVLIAYNARRGNLEEAYRLFINFKKRQGIVTGAMYTTMFNACANCKNSFLAIEKANAVTECMRNNTHHSINITNYNVMLKAYGRHGDIPTCLKIMDEVLERRHKVRIPTYNFMLQACISDKNSGLRHAFILWRKMLQNRVLPDIYSFNLLLRCIRECSLGDVLLLPKIFDDIRQECGKFFRRKEMVVTINGKKQRKVIKIPVSGFNSTSAQNETSKSPEENIKGFIELPSTESSQLNLEGKQETPEVSQSQEVLQMETGNSENLSSNLKLSYNENDTCRSAENFSNTEQSLEKPEECKVESVVSTSLNEFELPNFIALNPSTGSMVEFGTMTKAQDRFILVGGAKGFLKTMEEYKVKPDVKTFTLMLELIPPTVEAEQALMSLMETSNVKVDTGFFNILIKRRFFRKEDHAVKDCLEKMYSLDIKPDLITFGVLALGCNTYELGMDYLKTLHSHGYRANTEILETLLLKARRARDMNYVLAILRVAKEDGTDLNPKFLATLEDIVKKERYLKKKNAEKLALESVNESESVPPS